MQWFWRVVTAEPLREDWIVEEAPVVGRAGEVIRSRVNATQLDRVCRAREREARERQAA